MLNTLRTKVTKDTANTLPVPIQPTKTAKNDILILLNQPTTLVNTLPVLHEEVGASIPPDAQSRAIALLKEIIHKQKAEIESLRQTIQNLKA